MVFIMISDSDRAIKNHHGLTNKRGVAILTIYCYSSVV